MKVGIYGGTFDPIHFGHINLAIQIKEKKGLDEIWLVPTHVNPLKETISADPKHRLNMLQMAIENLPFIRISSIELDRPPPSYTVNTVQHLQESYPRHEFSLILGMDSISRFDDWKDPEGIIRRLPLIVGKRTCQDQIPEFQNNPLIQKAIKDGIIETSVLEISATDIRDRINRGLYIEHLVPSKVVDYIYDNHLYSRD